MGTPMQIKCGDDETEGAMPQALDSDRPEDRDLLERLSAKLRRLEGEAKRLAAMMRQRPKES